MSWRVGGEKNSVIIVFFSLDFQACKYPPGLSLGGLLYFFSEKAADRNWDLQLQGLQRSAGGGGRLGLEGVA